MVPFQSVLSEMRRVLRDARPELLLSLLVRLRDAQVFSSEYHQSLFQNGQQVGRTDHEELARKLALPVWQKWDVCEGILSSAFSCQDEFQPDDSDEFGSNMEFLGLPENLFYDYLESVDLNSPDGFDELLDSGFEDILNITGELENTPIVTCEDSDPSAQRKNRKRRGDRSSRKTSHYKRSKDGPPSPESPQNSVPAYQGSFQTQPQLVHLPFTITTTLENATLMPSAAGPALQIIQAVNPLSPPVIKKIVPIGSTYVLVSPQPLPRLPQIIPLSPVDGAVAPFELSMSSHPTSSLSDSVSRGGQPPSPFTPTSPSKVSEKTSPEISPSPSPCLPRPAKKRPSPTIPKFVKDYIQQLKSHLRETCSVMQGGTSLESHYVDMLLVQRKLVIRTGKNANKCLDKELVTISDSERKNAMLNRADLFQNCGGSKPKRLITIFGKAGTGKTSFIQRLALDWASGSFSQFHFVFLINCRVLDLTRTSYSLKDLLLVLSSAPHSQDDDALFKHVLSSPEKVLVVFDSFDDMKDLEGLLQNSATSSSDSHYSVRQLFSGLFQNKLLSGCTVLMVTRPKDVLNQLLRKVDSILELSNFSPCDIEVYTSKYFTDASLQEMALRSIRNQKFLFSLCSNPMLCWFTCFVLEHRDKNEDDLPLTLTDLCRRFLDMKLVLKTDQSEPQPDLAELCSKAWEGVKNHSSVLSRDKISEELVTFGLNSGVLASQSLPGTETHVVFFANLFLQSLLAALHLVQSKDLSDRTLLSQTTPVQHKKRKTQGQWQDILQRFTMGLLYQKPRRQRRQGSRDVPPNAVDAQAKRKAVESHLDNLKTGDLSPGRLLEHFHCIYEAGDAKLAKTLVRNLPDELGFCGAQLSLSDVHVVCQLLLRNAKGLKRTFCIDLQDVCVPLGGLRELVGLDCVTSYRAPTTDTVELWEDLHRGNEGSSLKNAINKFTINPFKASQVCDVDKLLLLIRIHTEKKLPCSEVEVALQAGVPAVTHLHKLEYELGKQNGPAAFPKLVEILPSLQSLQHLDLENNKIGDAGAERLAQVLQALSALKLLNLSQNCIGDVGVEKLAGALSAASSLQSLSLYGNLIADNGAESLAAVLPVMKCLLDLDVKYNKFTDNGAQKLGSALKSSPHMKSLQMWNECIPYGIFEHLQLQDSRIKSL